jgi:hypothetical protein
MKSAIQSDKLGYLLGYLLDGLFSQSEIHTWRLGESFFGDGYYIGL